MRRIPVMILVRLAWRNLWRNYRRTLVMLAAISVGVWAMIFMTALMRGMVDDMIEDGIRSFKGHVQIHNPKFRDDPSIVNSMIPPDAELLKVLQKAKAWGSRVRVPAVISSERESRAVVFLGVDPEPEKILSFVADKIIAGRFLESSDDRGLIIGAELAEKLETRLGKRVVVMSQDPDNTIVDRGFRIVGIFEASLPSLEEQFVLTGLHNAQNFLVMSDKISEIEAITDNYRDVELLFQRLENAVDMDREATPWYRLDSYLGTMMTVMDGFVLVWILVIFTALSFGLVNTLVMAVFERVREIGLMLALGMRPGAMMAQILIESLFLLSLGLAIGDLAAWASITPLKSGIDISIVAEGMEAMGAASVLYPRLYMADVVLANSVVILLGLLASILPSWRAAKYEPVEAITKTY